MANTLSTDLTNLVTAAYDKEVALALRSDPLFRNFAVKRPVDVSNAGSSIKLQFYGDMAPATTPLTEGPSPTPTTLGNTSQVTVTVNEYGNVVTTTNRLSVTSLTDIDRGVANLIAYNMADSLDRVANSVAITGTNRITSNAGAVDATPVNVNTLTNSDVFKSALPRLAVAKLRGKSAVPTEGSLYTAIIHPDVSHDFRVETGETGWREVHNFSGASKVWAGDVGVYEGVRYIESPRAYVATDGASSANVYRTLIFGQEALVEAEAQAPGVVLGPQTDPLERLSTIGWKAFLGYGIYRQDALWRVESGSSIA